MVGSKRQRLKAFRFYPSSFFLEHEAAAQQIVLAALCAVLLALIGSGRYSVADGPRPFDYTQVAGATTFAATMNALSFGSSNAHKTFDTSPTGDKTEYLHLNGNLRELPVDDTPRYDTVRMDSAGTPEGQPDDVRIWNDGRTQKVRSTIHAPITTLPTGLEAHRELNKGAGTVVSSTVRPVVTDTLKNTGYSWAPGAPFGVNLTPGQPTLIAPSNGATGVPLSPTLQVTVTDPQTHPMTVTFYGRAFIAASANPTFTLVALPDTQRYSAGNAAIFNAQTQWAADNKTARTIAFVSHLGDVVNEGGVEAQWITASSAMSRLETITANIPYGIALGNHDLHDGGVLYNQYFGESRFQGRDYYRGHYGTNNDNYYEFFSASGLEFIVINLEYKPGSTVLDWADNLLKTYYWRRGIVVSHSIIDVNFSSFSTEGQNIYDALKDSPNLFLMLCGHVHGEGKRSDTYNGNTVYTLLSNYQTWTNGGNGLLRVMEFSPARSEISVTTYSPYVNQYITTTRSQFTLTYDMRTQAGPFQVIGTNTNVPSGSSTSVVWPALLPQTKYEWYVTASDGSITTTSATWTFTTTTRYTLTVKKSGSGTGVVTSVPSGINCGSTCAAAYDYGTVVTLTATAGGASSFTGWNGACTHVSGNCGVTMTVARSVTATFALITHTLSGSQSGNGSGAVTSVPSGINCGSTCAAAYDYGTVVTLTATAGGDSIFTGWNGACTHAWGNCVVTMTAARSVTATFSTAYSFYLPMVAHMWLRPIGWWSR